jgi:uncharacterized membrane protein YdbT with pleckstrin-like domain
MENNFKHKHNQNQTDEKRVPNECRAQTQQHPLSVGAGQATIAGSLSGVIPAHLIDEGEQIIFAIKPSLWFILFYYAKMIGLVIAVFIAINYFPYVPSLFSQYVSQIAAALICLQLVIAVLEWISRLYVLTDRRVIRIKGILNVDIFEAPLVKIQNTYLTFALHERVVGIGTILIATAGTAGIEASWQNINQPLEVHEQVRAAIREAHRRWSNSNSNP